MHNLHNIMHNIILYKYFEINEYILMKCFLFSIMCMSYKPLHVIAQLHQ